MIRRGTDTDNYDGPVSVDRFVALKAKGYDFVIVGAQIGNDGRNYTQSQINNARVAGVAVPAVYELLYWDNRDLTRIEHAKSFGLPVWLDCEYQIGVLQPSFIIHRIEEAVAYLGDKCAGIYTGSWWWKPSTSNSERFSHLPLWHAAYPYGAQTLPPMGFVPDFNNFAAYGGWKKPTVWQYADVAPGEPSFDSNAWDVVEPKDPTLEIVPGRGGLFTVGKYQVLYNEGVPVKRWGGVLPGQEAKNFGGEWRWQRTAPDGSLYYSTVEGD
jgi:hypothetical protein